MKHSGELAAQRRVGVTVDDWGSAGVGATIPAVAADFLRQQQFVVLGAADDDGALWATAITGSPGLAEARDDRTVVIHATPGPGDPLAESFATPEVERDAGMIAIEPATRRRMRINGRARRSGNRIVIGTDQVYANCPKYIQTRSPEPLPAGAAVTTGAVTTDGLGAAQRQWIADADTFFVATAAAGLGADVSHRGGNRGFVTVTGSRRLTWPDYAGNRMFMTLGNLDLNPACGLLFLDWERGNALHLTGRARVDWDLERAAAVPGAQRLIDLEIDSVVEVAGAHSLRWTFGDYFRHNPPVAT